jgi:hypothetical protein
MIAITLIGSGRTNLDKFLRKPEKEYLSNIRKYMPIPRTLLLASD